VYQIYSFGYAEGPACIPDGSFVVANGSTKRASGYNKLNAGGGSSLYKERNMAKSGDWMPGSRAEILAARRNQEAAGQLKAIFFP
jgi:hypothetical protein